MDQAWQQILKVAWTDTLCREVSYYKVIKDYDKNDFLGASVIHGLKVINHWIQWPPSHILLFPLPYTLDTSYFDRQTRFIGLIIISDFFCSIIGGTGVSPDLR